MSPLSISGEKKLSLQYCLKLSSNYNNPAYATVFNSKFHSVFERKPTQLPPLAMRVSGDLQAVGFKKSDVIKAKGVKKHVVKKNVHHRDFLAVLKREKMNTVAKFNTFKSTNHVLNTVEMTKLCLNAFDDKRFILEDGTNTLPYGHYRT